MRSLRWLFHMRLAWLLRARGDRHAVKAKALFVRAKAHEDAADDLYTPEERGEQ